MNYRQLVATMIVAITCSTVTALLVSSRTAVADGDPATDDVPRYVAYSGSLELDGVPVTGAVDLRFDIYDGAAGAGSYSQSITLTAFNGEFTALLGPSDDLGVNLQDIVDDADDLRLGITLVGAGPSGEDIELANRQRFLPTPYAFWATEAASFTVNRDLTVANDATVTGDLTVNTTSTVNGTQTVTGTSTLANVNSSGTVSADLFSASAGSSGYEFPSNPFGGSGDDAYIRYVQDGTGEDTALQIVIENDQNDDIEFHQGGGLRMRVENSGVYVENNLVAPNNVRESCAWTSYFSKSPLVISPTCPSDQFMAGIGFTHAAGQNGTHEESIRLYCCEL